MNKTEQLSEALVYATDRLGYTVAEVFRIYTEVQTIKGIFGLLKIAVPTVVFGLIMYFSHRDIKGNETEEEEEAHLYLLAVVLGLMLAGLTSSIVLALQEPFLRLLAPEYMAIQDMLTHASGLMK